MRAFLQQIITCQGSSIVGIAQEDGCLPALCRLSSCALLAVFLRFAGCLPALCWPSS
jgi:hypothetical protein